MKTQDKNSNEQFDKRFGLNKPKAWQHKKEEPALAKLPYKKKFLLRQHEEHEAEEEIKDFKLDELDTNEDKQTRSKPD